METRINIKKAEPAAYEAMYGLEKYLSTTKIDPILLELIKMRASQINGCAFCLNMHSTDARKIGETEQRLYLLNAWRETTLFTEKEKAVLALTEEVTLISKHVSDETYRNASRFFNEQHLAQVIMAIITINAWNRIAIATKLMVG
ncbi:carboxymuconolactone decarboxylase family protein [Pedobacter sp. GR22-10]|jgi:AhpD family alkylhydroperoxidase|uniref:carboxymuconolactone decarboxylase family protein n=1 Tax=Pedobacter sp. GR22-10 TaxID=2994472 RepID=UPI0022458992|nr:carboxymuconolactone decarboxylase family protein [Pedobacter sp. GR22-10]MCX2431752.1 carboxymuconolactone decarboxylase family protein [Pedobacter sp. GR22-10]